MKNPKFKRIADFRIIGEDDMNNFNSFDSFDHSMLHNANARYEYGNDAVRFDPALFI